MDDILYLAQMARKSLFNYSDRGMLAEFQLVQGPALGDVQKDVFDKFTRSIVDEIRKPKSSFPEI